MSPLAPNAVADLVAQHIAAPNRRQMYRTGYASALYDVSALLRRLVIGVPTADLANALDTAAGRVQGKAAQS